LEGIHETNILVEKKRRGETIFRRIRDVTPSAKHQPPRLAMYGRPETLVLSRDLNGQCMTRLEEEGGDVGIEDVEFVRKVRRRFEHDFLPVYYGPLWRRMIATQSRQSRLSSSPQQYTIHENADEKNPTAAAEQTSHVNKASGVTTQMNRGFLDAIERRMPVMMSLGDHNRDCDCGCAPPIKEHGTTNDKDEGTSTIEISLPRANRVKTDKETPEPVLDLETLAIGETPSNKSFAYNQFCDTDNKEDEMKDFNESVNDHLEDSSYSNQCGAGDTSEEDKNDDSDSDSHSHRSMPARVALSHSVPSWPNDSHYDGSSNTTEHRFARALLQSVLLLVASRQPDRVLRIAND
jgi:hypothetical protein